MSFRKRKKKRKAAAAPGGHEDAGPGSAPAPDTDTTTAPASLLSSSAPPRNRAGAVFGRSRRRSGTSVATRRKHVMSIQGHGGSSKNSYSKASSAPTHHARGPANPSYDLSALRAEQAQYRRPLDAADTKAQQGFGQVEFDNSEGQGDNARQLCARGPALANSGVFNMG